MAGTSKPVAIIESVAPLAPRYDVWLCDVWGVIHNGERAFEPATAACAQFRSKGGTVVLISNSPRPRNALIEQLDSIGVPREAYDAVATSGELTRQLVSRPGGMRVFHMGPDRDKPIFAGLDVQHVALDQAEVVVCSGLYDDRTETPEDYAERLAELKRLGLTMICANPDHMVERGSSLIYCAGALAHAYEALGGKVVYAGKPHAAIYDLALQLAEQARGTPVESERVLAIGDGLATDMAGAFAAKIDALFVASGVHVEGHNSGEELEAAAVTALFEGNEAQPIAALSALKW
jgi:HAD superfamily hydrolase (TIGR01459 family)